MAEEFLQDSAEITPNTRDKDRIICVAPIFLFLAGVYDRDLMHSRKFQLFSGSFSNFSINAFPPPEYPDKPVDRDSVFFTY